MRFNKFLLAGVTALGLASTAMAGGRNPGSLLLFPEFDNRQANLTLLTVTNTNGDTLNGTIKVEFVYIGKYGANNQTLDCLEFNRTHTLTPNDTLSVITSAHNPGQEQGYVYVFAKDKDTGVAKVFNHLIGNEMTIMGIEALDYSLNPFQDTEAWTQLMRSLHQALRLPLNTVRTKLHRGKQRLMQLAVERGWNGELA